MSKPRAEKTARKRIIVVLGSHRSGTSALTKGMEVLGGTLGSVFLPADSCNEKGYWEDRDFLELNKQLLKAVGRDWYSIKPLEEEEAGLLIEKYFDLACELSREKTVSTSLLVVKDPRFSLLLMFWKKVFRALDLEDSYLIALRNPRDVADSITSRNQFPKDRGFWIWITYLLQCLEQTVDRQRILVGYQNLLRNPEEQIRRLGREFNLTPKEELLRFYRDIYLDVSLNHGRDIEDSGLEPYGPPLAWLMFEKLHEIANDTASLGDSSFRENFLGWKTEFSAAWTLLNLSQEQDVALKESQMLAGKRKERIFHLEKKVSEQSDLMVRRMAEFERSLEEARTEIAALRAQGAEMENALLSVEMWQRSWWRRAFTRWHRVQEDRRASPTKE